MDHPFPFDSVLSLAPPPLQVGILLYPQMALLDFAGPQAALGMHGQTYLLAKKMDCPKNLDVLLVPGGFGSNAAMQDAETLMFLAEAGKTARYVTSVCSGSLILGASGLLDGYKAATHCAAYEALEALGVDAVNERVVVYGNRVSGGGVTAGIDFGLTLLANLQLAMEYDPKPPFNVGAPEGAMLAESVVIATASRKARAEGAVLSH